MPTSPSSGGTSQRVLVVDDETTICDLVGKYLSRQGFEVVAVNSGAEALKVVDGSPFDLMILDIALEDSDGLELLSAVKATHPGLPVIMMTGMGFDEELVKEALSRRASGYVSKTLPMNQLLMEIRRVIKQSAPGA
jgi:two-component system, NtrC family, response regulator HydG